MNSPALASTITQSTTTAEALVTAKADAFIERERSALEKAGVPKEEIRNLLRSPAVKELKTDIEIVVS